MLSMIFGLVVIIPLGLIIESALLFSIIGIGISLGGLDILTCDKRKSVFPRGSAVVIGGLFFAMMAGWYKGPLASISSFGVFLTIGIAWRLAFG